jgi:hypothetical protein
MPAKERRAGAQKKEVEIAELTTWTLEYVGQNTARSPTDEQVQ